MSIFLKNVCSYCKKNFYTLPDLIEHIESDHLDFDPLKIDQLEKEKPEMLPLSYVLKYTNESLVKTESVIKETERDFVPLNNNYIEFSEKSEPRLNHEEFTQIFGGNRLFTLDHNHKKPFLCNMKGCEKRYKNVNGIKYHYKKHHKMLIPNLKKSLLKKPQDGTALYKPLDAAQDCDPNDYFYQFPTSETYFSSNQVPLNMSFNYYNYECDNEFFLPN